MILAILAGRAPGASYDAAVEDATKVMRDVTDTQKFSGKAANHRRGPHPSINSGISMGMGTAFPDKLAMHSYGGAFSKLVRNSGFQLLARYQTCKTPFQTLQL